MSRRYADTTLNCCVCGARSAYAWRRAGDHLLGGPRCFEAVRCVRCGTARLDPRPSAEEMARHYVPHTYARAEAEAEGSGLAVRLDATNHGIAARADRAAERVAPKRLLDIGCGDGRFLAAMAERGWQVEGLETDPVAADLARRRTGATVHEALLDDAGLPAGAFGMVSLLHVLEHVPDPRATLTAARSLLAPGGVLFLALPNAGSAEASLFRSCWYPLDLPRHFWGFNPRSLVRLTEECGFAVDGLTYFPFINSLQSVRYGLKAVGGRPIGDGVGRDEPVAEAADSPRTRVFLALMGLSERLGKTLPGEVMELIARRPAEGAP